MAVYTEVGDEELEALVAGYDIGAVTACKGIAEGVENSNFLLQTGRGSFILTLYEKRVVPEELPFFLGLMEHLAARGVPCPTPIHDRQGRALRQLSGRPAAIVTFLAGNWPRRPSPAHCAEVGGALAGLHQAASDYPGRRANALGLDGWRRLAAASADRADEVAPGLRRLIEDSLADLGRAWPAGLPAGIIHADLFPDNVFFQGPALTGLIDFYFACSDLQAYDLAICLNAWCFEPDGALNVTKARQLLAGYRRVRPLSAAEIEALPVLAQGAALRFLLTRTYDWLNRIPGALVRPKDPAEYIKKLNFHREVKTAAAYGIES